MASKDEPDEVIREKMWVSRPKGTHLSQSKKAAGESSPLTRDDDSNKLGHVTLSSIEDEDDWDESSVVYIENSQPVKSRSQEELEAALQEAVGHVVDYFLAKGEFHVKKFYNEKARPALRSKWENRPRRRKNKPQLPVSEQLSIAQVRINVSEEVEEASVGYRQNMSSTEAQARLVMAMLLRAMSDEQLEMVVNADIDLDGGVDELERRFAELPTEQVTYMIETFVANPSSLENQLLNFENLLGLNSSGSEQVVVEDRKES